MLTWAIVLLIKTEFGDPVRTRLCHDASEHPQGCSPLGIDTSPLGCVLYLSLFVSVLIAMLCDLVMVSIAGQLALAWAGCV